MFKSKGTVPSNMPHAENYKTDQNYKTGNCF